MVSDDEQEKHRQGFLMLNNSYILLLPVALLFRGLAEI